MLISRSANREEVIKRFKEAAGYQRQAVRCLFPERMGKHMDVIGNELKLMITEAAADLLKDCGRAAFCGGSEDDTVETKKSTGTKKVDIL